VLSEAAETLGPEGCAAGGGPPLVHAESAWSRLQPFQNDLSHEVRRLDETDWAEGPVRESVADVGVGSPGLGIPAS